MNEPAAAIHDPAVMNQAALQSEPAPTKTSMGASAIFRLWPGCLAALLIGALATFGASADAIQHTGLSALTLAIVGGIALGTLFPVFSDARSSLHEGIEFSKSRLLRAGIVLYGFRISFQQIAAVGWVGIAIDAFIVVTTFALAVQIGTRLLKLDRHTSMLIGAGSAICGAAAVLATEPVVRARSHQVSVAVATVVIFGTVAMFTYPLLYPYLGFSAERYGIFAGSTIHEVAQVLAAGKAVSDAAAANAVIAKMIRVMMLAPFLLVLSRLQGRHPSQEPAGAAGRRSVTIPWFAVLFIVASGIASLQLLPTALIDRLTQIDNLLLCMAMAALGLRTPLGAVRQAGIKPMLLAAVLFLHLVLGGYCINWLGARFA